MKKLLLILALTISTTACASSTKYDVRLKAVNDSFKVNIALSEVNKDIKQIQIIKKDEKPIEFLVTDISEQGGSRIQFDFITGVTAEGETVHAVLIYHGDKMYFSLGGSQEELAAIWLASAVNLEGVIEAISKFEVEKI